MAVSSPDRFHALDATRAFALLLGVVFHAAWSFVPRATGGPITDVSGHLVFDWFFFTSHSFRMQVFFLIAGFFGHMLYHKRGWRGFAQHRLSRIAIPFVIGWVILCPLVLGAWTWGANVSGKNLLPLPLPVLFDFMYAKGLVLLPRAQGGLFSLLHLWFLYYLLWIMALVVVGRALVVRIPSIRERTDRLVTRLVDSPWSLAGLAVITGLFLWPMEGWFGVDTPVRQLTPSLPVIILYGTFFALGWLLHRQVGLLPRMARHWRWQIAVAVVVSLGCFAIFDQQIKRGAPGSAVGAYYPDLWPNQISDWSKFAGTLRSAENPGQARPELVALWQKLPPPARTAILQMPAAPSPDAQAGVCEAINKLLLHPALFTAQAAAPTTPPSAAEAMARRQRNRDVLESVFGAALTGDPTRQPNYQPLKLAYSVGYGLLMWLLVFGSLGFFQARCAGASAAWRYVADSAYWIYLAHLPLVAALQVWMAHWNLPAVIKYPLLLAIAFTVLFASYHYLVRSTFIGRMLNGQRHPFTPWPFATRAHGAPAARPVAVGAAAE